MLDRAEEVFQKLPTARTRARRAATCSRSTSRRRTGTRRSTMAKRLETEPASRAREIAHYLCELAATEATQSRPDAARAPPRGGARGEPQVRARQPAARRPGEELQDNAGQARSSTGSASSRRIPPTSRWSRSACSRRYRDAGRAGGGPDAARRLPGALPVARPARRGVPADARGEGRGSRPTSWCATSCGATRRCSASTGCSRRRSSPRLARRAPRPGAGAQPGAQPYAAPGALPLRELRLQGAPVPLALPGLRRLGDLPAAAHRGIRPHAMKRCTDVIGTGYVGLVTGRLPRRRRQRRAVPRRRRAEDQRAERRRDPDLRAGPGADRAAQPRRRPAAVHDRRRGERGARRAAVHRGRHAAGRGRLGRHAVRARGGAQHRPAHGRRTRSSSTSRPCRWAPPTRCSEAIAKS